MTSLEAIRDAITRRHHPPIPAPSRVEPHQAKQLHLKTTIIARMSIQILNKTYPTKVISSHVGFWLVGLFCQKQLGSWILTFNILAQILVRLTLL
jgi:recombinational DNA repair protein RecT